MAGMPEFHCPHCGKTKQREYSWTAQHIFDSCPKADKHRSITAKERWKQFGEAGGAGQGGAHKWEDAKTFFDAVIDSDLEAMQILVKRHKNAAKTSGFFLQQRIAAQRENATENIQMEASLSDLEDADEERLED